MRPTRTVPALLISSACLLALPAMATAGTPAPAPPPVAPPVPAAPAAPAPAPAAGKLRLVLQHVGGTPLFAPARKHIVVRGIVVPYVPGQTVELSFFRDGKKSGVQSAAVVPVGNGAGQFHVSFTSGDAGRVEVQAAHAASAAQGAFSAHSRIVQFVHTNVGPGSHGLSVRLLQTELANLRYAIPVNGIYDEATGRALIAFRKMTGLERVPSAGARVFALLSRGAGRFHVHDRHDGRHVEANLTKQVLAEIEPDGRVHAIYTTSSGKPSTPTVIGRFQVYEKTPGTNSEGMVDSNYFIRGYAIHGYHEVPTFAASHGCLRVPIPDAAAIFAWVRDGTPVDVYNEDGGGSARVRSDAGP
jgi:peptidoglycan hydrolase-like protein with peptidoglycan-binding domain